MYRHRVVLSIRTIVALLIVLNLCWLAYDNAPRRTRQLLIARYLQEGLLGLPDTRDAQKFDRVARLLVKAARIRDVRIGVNTAPTVGSGELGIYVTSADAASLTGCVPGNAVYDAGMDTIYVDRSLFDASDFSTTPDDSPIFIQPPMKLYVCYLMLHELGHRQLHRKSKPFWDSFSDRNNGVAQRQENEADEFALSSLIQVYNDDFDAISDYVGDLSDTYLAAGLPQQEGAPLRGASNFMVDARGYYRRKVFLDLAAMAFTMCYYQLFSGTPFSPYYGDTAHVEFVDRALGIVDTVLKQRDLDAAIVATMRIAREKLERIALVQKQIHLIVLAPTPIQEICFGTAGVYVMTDSNDVYYADNGAQYQNRLRGGNTLVLQPRDLVVNASDKIRVARLWYCPPEGLIGITKTGKFWKAMGNRWVPFPTGTSITPNKASNDQKELDVSLPPQPSLRCYAIIQQSAVSSKKDNRLSDSRRSYLCCWTGHFLRARTLNEVASEIYSRAGRRDSSLKILAVTDRRLYLAVGRKSETVAMLDANTLRVLALFHEPANRQSSRVVGKDDELTVYQSVPAESASNLASVRVGPIGKGPSKEWVITIWPRLPTTTEPSDSLPPDPIMAHISMASDAFLMGSVEWLPVPTEDEYVLTNFTNDSVYQISLSTGAEHLAFHPGGVSLTAGSRGLFAAYFPIGGGRKLYVLASDHSDRTR